MSPRYRGIRCTWRCPTVCPAASPALKPTLYPSGCRGPRSSEAFITSSASRIATCSSRVASNQVATCRRGIRSVCPSLTGKPSSIATTRSLDQTTRPGGRQQNGQLAVTRRRPGASVPRAAPPCGRHPGWRQLHRTQRSHRLAAAGGSDRGGNSIAPGGPLDLPPPGGRFAAVTPSHPPVPATCRRQGLASRRQLHRTQRSHRLAAAGGSDRGGNSVAPGGPLDLPPPTPYFTTPSIPCNTAS